MWIAAGPDHGFWVALGTWVAVFPGTIEKWVGIDYDFEDTWGCRARRSRRSRSARSR